MILLANLFFALLTYLIESRICSGCSYEFNVVYVQREKNSICYTTASYEVNIFKNKNKRKSLRDIFVYHFLFIFFLFFIFFNFCYYFTISKKYNTNVIV